MGAMKTALICMLQLHKSSGSARTALENIKYFKAKGYEVHVASMTLDRAFISAQGAIAHKMLPWLKSTGVWRRRWYNWQIKKLRAKLKPDITVGHGDIQEQDVLTLHNCVFLASELINNKNLAADHEMALTHGPLLSHQHFKKMIANSELMKADTIKRFGISSDKIEVVYPALDVEVFYPKPQLRAELRKRFGFPDKVIVALVTSGNFRKRGLDLFSEAIDKLPEQIKQMASFRVVGKDNPSSNLSTQLVFDPGLDDIENYYRAIDIFILPARIEEFGRVVLEAMASGLPVITTRTVGAGELIAGEAREFVISPNDVNAIIDSLIKLIPDSQLQARIGSLNAQTALTESEENVFKKFDKVFSAL